MSFCLYLVSNASRDSILDSSRFQLEASEDLFWLSWIIMKCCSEYAYQFASLEMESSFALFASFVCLLFLIIILRIMWVISSRRFEACNSREASVKMLVVVGSGLSAQCICTIGDLSFLQTNFADWILNIFCTQKNLFKVSSIQSRSQMLDKFLNFRNLKEHSC